MKNKPKPNSNTLLFLMKITLIYALITTFTIVLGYALDSSGQGILDRKVSLQVDRAKVKDVLSILEQRAGVSFTYRPRLLKKVKSVSLDFNDTRLEVVLSQLFDESIRYEVIGKQIVLRETFSASEEADEVIAPARAPAIQVSGKVTDDTGAGLPGVNIIEKGTTNGTATDSDGRFTLLVNENAVLVFSFIGYATQEVSVNNRTTIDVSLAGDTKTLDEVVVVGYGQQKKITVTGAVVAVDGKELEKSPSVNLSNAFAGRLAGVVAVQTSGEPGNDNSTIRIRGVNTIGNTSPLIVVDGIPDRDGGLNRISPQDVESISVLKDASSAIYGSRAANGVILITTKRGKTGAPQVTYDFNQGWSQPTRIPKMSNAVEYANIMNEIPIYKSIPSGEWAAAWASIQATGTYDSPTAGVSNLNANYYPADVQKYKDGSDPWGHPDTDWFGDAFKTWSPQSRHNLQISGGSDNVKYHSSLGYTHQDAYYKNSATFYKQYNFRINLDAKVNKYINTSLGLLAREESRNYPTQSAGSIFRMLMRGRPTEPEVWPNGKPGPDIENGQNPYVITTNATGYDRNPTDYLQSNGRIEITNPWIEGLKVTLSGAIDKTIDQTKRWETPWYLYTWDKVSYEADGVTPLLTRALRSTFTDPRLTRNVGNRLSTNATAMLNYDRTIAGNHTVGILVGVTKEKFTADYLSAYRREYISTAIDQPFFGGGTQLIGGGNDNFNSYNRARLGYYGRVTYNFKEKYLAEFMWRRDASSFFHENNRVGFFPGILVGWNISNEDFFANNVSFFDFLKIRASYGQMGSDQIYGPPNYDRLIEYAFLSVYNAGNYPIGSQVVTTLHEGIVANPNYTWEVSNNSNVGVEGTILDNKFDFTLEYFYNKRSNMLVQKQGSTPTSTGIATKLPPVNIGQMDNKGFEFTLGYNGTVSGLTYRLGVNAGYNKNKVVFMDEITASPSYQWQTGHPWRAYLAYKSDGVFKSQEEIDQETTVYTMTNKLLPGDMKFVDVNNDGQINGDDKVRLDKSNTPNFNYGVTMNFQYRNFDLSILLQGAAGALLRFGTESGDIGNYLKYSHDNRWTIDNPSSEHPRLAIRNDTYYTGGEYSANTYNLFNKNYVRLKNVELGYNIPVDVSQRVNLSMVRIYVNGLNLVTWDKYKIFDPEADSGSLQYYPQARVINTGVRLTF